MGRQSINNLQRELESGLTTDGANAIDAIELLAAGRIKLRRREVLQVMRTAFEAEKARYSNDNNIDAQERLKSAREQIEQILGHPDLDARTEMSTDILRQLAGIFDDAVNFPQNTCLSHEQIDRVQTLAPQIAGELGIDLMVFKVRPTGHCNLQVRLCSNNVLETFRNNLKIRSGVDLTFASTTQWD